MSDPLPRQTGPTIAAFEQMYIKPCSVSSCHVGYLLFQKAGENYRAARADERPERRCKLDQRSRQDIRDQNIHALGQCSRALTDSDSRLHFVRGRIFPGRRQRLRIDVETIRVSSPQLDRCDREDAGSAAEVNNDLTLPDTAIQPLQAKPRGRMSSGPERESRIHSNDDGAWLV